MPIASQKIDAHQHFWNFTSGEFGWIPDDQAILRRNYLPQDLLPELRKADYSGSIAVQSRQTLEETRWLLELADAHSFIKGVVGWVDLRSADLDSQLAAFSVHQKFKGVRHVVQNEPDDRFMLQPAFTKGIACLASRQLLYEILIYARQLPAAIELVKRFPNQLFVLDHLAKPDIRNSGFADWARNMKEVATYPNVHVKVSGMVTEADPENWKPADFKAYVALIIASFGYHRILLGSDWPVCLQAATYPQVMCLAEGFFESAGQDVLDQVRGENAARLYRL